MRRAIVAGIIFLGLLGCLASGKKELLRPSLWNRTEWTGRLRDDADKSSLQAAVDNSLTYLRKKTSGKPAVAEGENFHTFQSSCDTLVSFKEILMHARNDDEFERKVLDHFTFWEAGQGRASGGAILTGYYEPVFAGSVQPGGDYRYPIYRLPGDLVEIKSGNQLPGVEKRIFRMEKGAAVPYYSRREIDTQGVLRGKGYEIAWLKDPWERFILHVQGSGQIRLPDKGILRVGFAGSNGRRYSSIGRYLLERGWLREGQTTLRHIKEFLRRHPEKAEEVFNANERYIFFRPVSHKQGPLGSLGLPLVGGRSVATDLTIFPPGALAYLSARLPICDSAGRIVGRKSLGRFVLNQDTGAAMKGPDRVDLFCGSGEQAGKMAGEMREEARIYFLMQK